MKSIVILIILAFVPGLHSRFLIRPQPISDEFQEIRPLPITSPPDLEPVPADWGPKPLPLPELAQEEESPITPSTR
ncbi:hypothetical protein Zmor_024545 [Zophobas morio]|uniref:Uncharacterized protein n=1 Tax=Zophobas morio TaxID=2755281 RepID=A0AA38I2N1_9CUCU|nr:hypothetical protein Zmor_024545 [Zophobas morio]